MNVSFSTRGWQQIPWEQQVQMAETMRFGAHGVDHRIRADTARHLR